MTRPLPSESIRDVRAHLAEVVERAEFARSVHVNSDPARSIPENFTPRRVVFAILLKDGAESASAPKLPTPPKPSGDDLKPFLGHWSPYGPRSY
ncbi:hypothetical protein ACWGNE_09415 [Streptomyces xiamenensis]|uniref:hypothetical protein n=1 Tax=Streptomyces xiamenensis TaxID=408015 RepID=UPI0036C2B5B7